MSRDSIRVAFDATPLQRKRSGIGMYTENLIRALLETRECEVVLLSNRPLIPLDELEPADRHASNGFPIRAVWMQAFLPHVLAQVRPSLCHFPNYLAPLRAPCPRVVTFHDMSLHRYPEFFSGRKRYLSRQLLPLVAQRAEGIITVSEYSRREIIELLGVPRRRVHVIYEAAARTYQPIIDPMALESVRRRFELPSRFILSVGTIEPRKNIGRLLTAFEGLVADGAFRDVQLVLVGESGWKNRDLLLRIGEAQSRGRVRYLGYLPQEDLPALYSLASVLAYPSIYEGFGLPIVEAMACGTPVLTSNRASMAEIAGSAAYLVDPEDTQSIRRGLEAILRHRDLAVALSQRGRDRAARFSWSETAERTLEVYREVLRSTKTRPSRAAGGDEAAPPSSGSHSELDPVTALRGECDRTEMCRCILRTVIYADLFDSPIAIDSLHRDLIGCRATREQVESCLDEDPWLRDRVVRRQDVVLLKGREALADRRRQQREETRALVQRNRRLLGLLSLVPFLRMLAFSGGTSHENSPGRPDLDLFIVTARGRVWAVYGIVVLLTRLCGCRRTICANYFVDTNHLCLPRPGDLFTGHQLLFVKPLTGAVWANRLLEQNPWIGDLFPNAGTLSKEHLSPGHPRLQRGCEIVLSPAWLLWEKIARRLFRPRIDRQAKASATADVLVDDGILKLHIQDRRAPAIARFRERLQKEGVWHPALESCLRLGRASVTRRQACHTAGGFHVQRPGHRETA